MFFQVIVKIDKINKTVNIVSNHNIKAVTDLVVCKCKVIHPKPTPLLPTFEAFLIDISKGSNIEINKDFPLEEPNLYRLITDFISTKVEINKTEVLHTISLGFKLLNDEPSYEYCPGGY